MAHFKNKGEEIIHWKDKCAELERDLAELSVSSKQVENELETMLKDADRNNKELRTKNNRMKLDFETLQDKLSQFQEDSFRQIEELQGANSTFQEREENYKKYIRELEQKIDENVHRDQNERNTLQCSVCGRQFKHPLGLGSHKRGKHCKPRAPNV